MGEEQDFNDDKHHSQNEERDDFPAREPGEVVTEKEQRKTDRGKDPRPGDAGDFEFEVSADDTAEQKQWGERGNPKGKLLETRRLKCNYIRFQPGLLHKVDNRIGDAVGQQRFTTDSFRRFLRVQRQDRSFRVNDAIADFHFLVLVHERFTDVFIVTVLLGRTADQR